MKAFTSRCCAMEFQDAQGDKRGEQDQRKLMPSTPPRVGAKGQHPLRAFTTAPADRVVKARPQPHRKPNVSRVMPRSPTDGLDMAEELTMTSPRRGSA